MGQTDGIWVCLAARRCPFDFFTAHCLLAGACGPRRQIRWQMAAVVSHPSVKPHRNGTPAIEPKLGPERGLGAISNRCNHEVSWKHETIPTRGPPRSPGLGTCASSATAPGHREGLGYQSVARDGFISRGWSSQDYRSTWAEAGHGERGRTAAALRRRRPSAQRQHRPWHRLRGRSARRVGGRPPS